MLNKILCVILLGFFAGLAPADAQTAPTAPARVKGRIIAARVIGHVEVISKTGAPLRVLHDGDEISDQTTVNTSPGAQVVLVFSNGASVNVAADSSLDIDQFEQDPFAADLKVSDMTQEQGTSTTKLNLAKGELVGKVVHLNVEKGSEFSVQTPVGAAGIRGTVFKIIFRTGRNGKTYFTVMTTEGVVVFRGVTSTPVSIPAGKLVVATFDTAAPTAAVTITSGDVNPTEAAAIQTASQTITNANQIVTFTGGSGAGGGGTAPPTNTTPSPPVVSPPVTTSGAGTGS
jgi:hypothetical protein